MSPSQTTTTAPALVPQDRRATFLPELFGANLVVDGETTLNSIMKGLSPEDVCQDSWEFYELDGAPLYIVPASQPSYRLFNPQSGYDAEFTSGLAGIIITLVALSILAQQCHCEHVRKSHARLYAFAMAHPKAAEIFAVID
jgi:hypothetical protein